MKKFLTKTEHEAYYNVLIVGFDVLENKRYIDRSFHTEKQAERYLFNQTDVDFGINHIVMTRKQFAEYKNI